MIKPPGARDDSRSTQSEADTRAKLIDPAIRARGWTEAFIRCEESAQANQVKGRRSELKNAEPRDQDAIESADTTLAGPVKEAREATAKAEAIAAAVYDLNAVNPNRKANVDTRTPGQFLDLIEAKGREIASALAVLRKQPAAPPG